MFETDNPNILSLQQKMTERGLAMRLIGKHRFGDGATAIHVEIHVGGLGICEAIILDLIPMGYQMFLCPKGITYDDDIEALEERRSSDHAKLRWPIPG